MAAQQQVPYRGIQTVDGFSPQLSSALQLIGHSLVPLRKVLVHLHIEKDRFHMDTNEWRFLSELGRLFQQLVAKKQKQKIPKKDNDDDDDDEDDDDDDEYEVIDPTACYEAMKKVAPTIVELSSAIDAISIILTTIQKCSKTLSLTKDLWNALLDKNGMGWIVKQSIVGRQHQKDENIILQRTIKETRILPCPLIVKIEPTNLQDAIQSFMKETMDQFDWHKSPFDFEVSIPLLSPVKNPSHEWNTTRITKLHSLPNYLILGLDRFTTAPNKLKKSKSNDNDRDNDDSDSDSDDDDDTKIDTTPMQVPNALKLGKYCTSTSHPSNETTFELIGGILYDEGDYVAILKNIVSKDEENWNLMEDGEVIPMPEKNVLEFLQGGESVGVYGVVLVYSKQSEQAHKQSNSILSDIVMSYVSGYLDSSADYYIEEEIIDDDEEVDG